MTAAAIEQNQVGQTSKADALRLVLLIPLQPASDDLPHRSIVVRLALHGAHREFSVSALERTSFLKHHHACYNGLAANVGNIVRFDIIWHLMQSQQPCQLVESGDFAAGAAGLFGDLLAGVLLCHGQQLHLIALLRNQQLDAASRLFGQIGLQLVAAADFSIQYHRLWHAVLHAVIAQHKLSAQLLQHLVQCKLLRILFVGSHGGLGKLAHLIEHEVLLVHQFIIPELEHHCTAFDRRLHQRNDVLLLIADGHHLLVLLQALDSTDAVAVARRFFVLHLLGSLHHLFGQHLLDLRRGTLQEADRLLQRFGILLRADLSAARRHALLDMVI